MTEIAPHKQYIDLYLEHKSLVERDAPSLLNEKREFACQMLREMGLPPFKSEEYQRIDVPSAFDKNYGLNLNRAILPAEDSLAYSCDIDKEDLAVKSSVFNDDYRQTFFENAKRRLPKEVFVGSIVEFATLYPEIAAKHYAKAAEVDTDGLVALNTMLVQDAFVLYIPRGVRVEQPIHLVQMLRSGVDLLCNRRGLVILEEDAKATLLVCDHTLDSVDFLVNQVIEVYVAKKAHFELYDLEENSSKVTRFSSFFVRQEANSCAAVRCLTLNNGVTRNNIRARFLGPNAEISVDGLGIGGNSQYIDNLMRVEHTRPDCKSNQLFKYILNDQASGAFSGRIFVANGAQHTEALQNNRNLLLSSSAKMYSKPQLEIYADDVKCTHGLTTGELDEEALFYMQQRGIPEEQARIMLSIAFADDIVRLIPLESLRNKVYEVIESRFSGDVCSHKHCSKCGKMIF